MNRSIPSHFPDRQKLLDLIPKTEQVDGVISLVYALSDKVIYAIEKMDKLTLYNSLYAYLDKHPHRHLMNIPSDNSSETGQTFNDYVNDLYFQIVRFADSGSPQKERYTALKNLVYNQTFTDYVFIEFLPTLIPANIAMDAMSLKMSVASNSIALTEVKIGNNQYSSVYSAVLLLRSILNDRSLDLRLESIISDTEITNGNPMTIQGFKIAD